MTEKPYFLGLMSGTSADGIDAVIVSFAPICILAKAVFPFPPEWRALTLALGQGQVDVNLDQFGALDQAIGQCFADCANALIAQSGIDRQQIAAIGSHGQTVRHRPNANWPFSLQLGCPHRIAEKTGLTVVADFRRRDVAAGGQGAPLVPAFHRAIFGSQRCVVLNLGGIANITVLENVDPDRSELAGPDSTQPDTAFSGQLHVRVRSNRDIDTVFSGQSYVRIGQSYVRVRSNRDFDTAFSGQSYVRIGHDTGPANALLDAWFAHTHGKAQDHQGQFAASGQVHPELLQRLLADPYFSAKAPKSTGREYFNLRWLQAMAGDLLSQLPAADVQASLAELTAQTVANEIQRYQTERVWVCGGGVHNADLMRRLQNALPCPVQSSAEFGLDPDYIEAACFAWLARETLANRSGNLPAVTGASAPRILGCIIRP
jgi:anhydro-N-acetylmuramic acid kinase